MGMRKMVPWLGCLVLCCCAGMAGAGEWSGNVTGAARVFPHSPLDPVQPDETLSLSLQPEYYHEWAERRESFLFVPYLRLDWHDDPDADVRELLWQKSTAEWDISLGVGRVFWGVVESQHLVDIINQSDMSAGLLNDEKMGQLMLNASWVQDWGTLDFFLMPHFRERVFPGEEGRPRTPYPVSDDALYESGAEEWHLDGALRWYHSLGEWDIGLSYFHGTNRDPYFIPRLFGIDLDFVSDYGNVVSSVFYPILLQLGLELVPYYTQIDQVGLDLQWTHEAWIGKLEAIHRSGDPESFTAFAAGVEYTFSQVFESTADVGLMAEFLYDSRRNTWHAPFENELFLGTRIMFNDVQSTSILAGGFVDLDSGALVLGFEAERRIGEDFKIRFETRVFANAPGDDPVSAVEDDDYLQLEFSWYF